MHLASHYQCNILSYRVVHLTRGSPPVATVVVSPFSQNFYILDVKSCISLLNKIEHVTASGGPYSRDPLS